MTKALRYNRLLLKVSGEALMGERGYGIDPGVVSRIADDIRNTHALGVQVGVVVGGGNIFRGVSSAAIGIERSSADHMGMLATVMNALALESALMAAGVPSRVQSAIPMPTVCEPYTRRDAVQHLENGRVVVFAAGTGNPYFTTDTAAALRAVETGCEVLLKATQVDGVYSADPKSDPNAERYDHISYQTVVANNLKVMDTAAIALARDNGLPVIVFSIHSPGALTAVLQGTGRYTLIE